MMSKRKINRYLRYWQTTLRHWTYRQKRDYIPTPMLRGIELKRRQPRYTGYSFTSAYILTSDGRKVPLSLKGGSLALDLTPMEETQEIPVFLPTSISISFTLPPSASHLFAHPESDPTLN